MQRKLCFGWPIACCGIWLATALCLMSGNAKAQWVTLDHVDGLQGVDTVVSGQEIVLHIRFTADDTLYGGMNNGFRVYSPDGAEWSTISGEWSEFISEGLFPMQFVRYRSVTGANADTLGFTGFYWTGLEGIPPGFDSVAVRIAFGPVDTAFEGKTVCVDSAFYPPGNHWKWVPYHGGATPVYPSWDGPHCFTVAAPAGCCATRGDVNDSGFGPDISDLLYLLDYLINGGPAPPCMEQADVNGSGGDADSDDFDYLEAHMFLGGPPPVACE